MGGINSLTGYRHSFVKSYNICACTEFHLLPLSYPTSSFISYHTIHTIQHCTHTHPPFHTLFNSQVLKTGVIGYGDQRSTDHATPVNSALWWQPFGRPWPTLGCCEKKNLGVNKIICEVNVLLKLSFQINNAINKVLRLCEMTSRLSYF